MCCILLSLANLLWGTHMNFLPLQVKVCRRRLYTRRNFNVVAHPTVCRQSRIKVIERSVPLWHLQCFIFFFAFNENAMAGSGHCNITMICACCDLNITLLFGAPSKFSHVELTTAASVLSCMQAVTLASQGIQASPAFSKCWAVHKSKVQSVR